MKEVKCIKKRMVNLRIKIKLYLNKFMEGMGKFKDKIKLYLKKLLVVGIIICIVFIVIAMFLLGVYIIFSKSLGPQIIIIGLLMIAFSLAVIFGVLFFLNHCCCLIVSTTDFEGNILISGKKYRFKKHDQKVFYFFRPGEYDIVAEGKAKPFKVMLYPGEVTNLLISNKNQDS